MNQNTGQHPSRKETAASLRLKPESGPPDGTDSVEDLSQLIPLRKACVCITPARIRTQVHGQTFDPGCDSRMTAPQQRRQDSLGA